MAHIGADGSSIFVCCRVLPDGKLDRTFNTNGTGINGTGFPGSELTDFTPQVGVGTTSDFRGGHVVVDQQGRIYFVGKVGAHVGILRYTADGGSEPPLPPIRSPPPTADERSSAACWPTISTSASPSSRTGRFSSPRRPPGTIGVNRINPDGSLDSSFGTAGQVNLTLPAAPRDDVANRITVGADGKIRVFGVVTTSTQVSTAIASLNPDGSLDTTFNGTGLLLTDTQAARRVTIVESNVPRVRGNSNSFADCRRPGPGERVHRDLRLPRVQRRADAHRLVRHRLRSKAPAEAGVHHRPGDLRHHHDEGRLGPGIPSARSQHDRPRLTNPRNVVIKSSGPITLNEVAVSGTLNNLTATSATLAGTLTTTGGIGTVKLGSITGTIAAVGTIGTINASSTTGAKVLSGANLGSDGQFGGGNDTFSFGTIRSVNVSGAMNSTIIEAGANPGPDGIFGTDDDTNGGGGTIRQIVARGGASADSHFEAGVIGSVKIPKKILSTDPRIKLV